MPHEAPPSESESVEPELPTWARRGIQLLVLGTTAAGVAGTALLPYLLVEHPFVLLLSSSDARNIVLVAPQLDCAWVALIAVPRRVVSMVATYGLGVLYGRVLLGVAGRRLPRVGRLLAAFERWFLRYRAAWLLGWPSYTTNLVAGITRTPFRTFVPWMVLGQLAFVLASYYLGQASSQWTERFVRWLQAHMIESTLACLGAVAGQQAISYARRRRAKTLRAEPP